ncbi:hypothetical protein DFH09DRAFT_1072204 [Mycena vulgaris]|nr:hypothetical protein DFH09DRAFT_1072204 [Mycena vulgaris]
MAETVELVVWPHRNAKPKAYAGGRVPEAEVRIARKIQDNVLQGQTDDDGDLQALEKRKLGSDKGELLKDAGVIFLAYRISIAEAGLEKTALRRSGAHEKRGGDKEGSCADTGVTDARLSPTATAATAGAGARDGDGGWTTRSSFPVRGLRGGDLSSEHRTD